MRKKIIAGFIVSIKGSYTTLYLSQANSEVEALQDYLEVDYNYTKQPDGSFQRKEIPHSSLQEALEANNIISRSDGSFEDFNENIYPNIHHVVADWNIKPQPDGTYTSLGKIYTSLEQVLDEQVRPFYRIEVHATRINEQNKWQSIFSSKDEWEYIENSSFSEIAREHWWQARRYMAKGDLVSAISEMRKCLKTETSRRNILSVHFDLARLQWKLGLLNQAANTYRNALRICIPSDNSELIHYYLAQVLEENKKLQSSLRHYTAALQIEPDFEDRDEILRKIEYLSQAKGK